MPVAPLATDVDHCSTTRAYLTAPIRRSVRTSAEPLGRGAPWGGL